MKNKPTKHKESNTFRFVPFADRISSIDVDVFHQIDRRRGIEDEGEKQTFFFLALEKWSVLNCTESYLDFRRRLISPGDVETLPQLLLQSKDITKTLLKNLTASDYLSLQPVLECVIALAKDLRNNFYPYFPAFLIRIVNILTAPVPPEGRGQKEAEIAEWCLSCLAHLCKILWRSMLKDWDYVFGSLLLPLILVRKDAKVKKSIDDDVPDKDDQQSSIKNTTDSQFEDDNMELEMNEENELVEDVEQTTNVIIQPEVDSNEDVANGNKINRVEETFREKLLSRPPPEYVRDFVVQSFAFVARKAKDKSGFLESVLGALTENKSAILGTGQLLAEVMKGVHGHFHSCADSFLPLLLQLACSHSEESGGCFDGYEGESIKEEERTITFQLVKQTLLAVMSTIKPDKGAGLLWKCLLDSVKQCISNYKTNFSEKQQVGLHRSLILLHAAINFNGGKWLSSEIGQHKGIFPTVQATSSLPLPNQLANLVASVLQLPTINDRIALEVGGMAGSILSSPAVAEGWLRLGQEVAAKLTSQVLTFSDTAVIINFVQKTTNFSGFEALVLPHLMSFCYSYCSKSSGDSNDISGKDVFRLLACLIVKKASPCATGGNALKNWQQYHLDFNRTSAVPNQTDIVHFHDMLKEVLSIPVKKEFSHLENFISALIILPHLKGVGNLGKVLADSINLLFDTLEETQENEHLKTEDLFFIISECLIAAVLTKDDIGRISRHISFDRALNLLLKHTTAASRLPVLRALDIYVTATVSDENFSEDKLAILNRLYNSLSGNLASPYREVCRLTLHLLSVVEKAVLDKENDVGIFSACLAAEEIPLSIHDFREKIGLLEALKPGLSEANNSSSLHAASLQYLLGINFVNFRLLWEPTCKLIVTHARACPNSFWEVFVHHFRLSMAFVKVEAGCKLDTDEMKLAAQLAKKWESCDQGFLSNCDFLHKWYVQRFTLSDSPDFVNYRIQLINAMCEAPEVCEARNRDLSDIFLSFYREEFIKSDSKVAPTWNIRKAEDVEMKEVDNDDDFDEFRANSANTDSGGFSVRFSTKTLVAFLSLMSKMRNPKAMYKEPELTKIYEELISYRNPEIQKHALDCLLAYRLKRLLPYRENLYNLLDEKKFKSELNLFRIDKESEIVKEEHRSHLVPIVMQVLYSKMQLGNKRTGHLRRSLVLRFIAGCHDMEIVIFLKMAFGLLSSYIEDKSEEVTTMVRRIISSVELERAVHPKRLLSTSNLLVVVVERLGNLLLSHGQASSTPSDALCFLLRCILGTNALIAGEYAKKALIHPCHLASLRSARASGLGAVATFFRRLERYPWSASSITDGMVAGDLEALFDACVWPWLDQLPIEGIHSPTALLKLFIVWSENPRYYPLLAKKCHSSEAQYNSVIPAIMSLLAGNKTKPSVINAILDMIERLITYASEEEVGIPMEVPEEQDDLPELPPLDVGPIIELHTEGINNLQLSHKLNFGSSLILPHVPCIIGVLYQRFRSLKKGSSPSARDLRVLSLLSELVWESKDSESLIQLILPIAVRKASLGATGEQMCQLLLTANNLLRNVPNPTKFLRSIAPLFSMVEGHNARSILCQILVTIAMRKEKTLKAEADVQEKDMKGNEDDIESIIFEEDLKITSKIINDLNSWDPCRLEEPDYGRRLDTYKRLKSMRESASNEEAKFPLMLGTLLIHNSFHVIKCEKDLSLRENAGHCLQTLAPLLAISVSQNNNCRNLVIGETLLSLITKALKDRKASDSLLYETIGTLGALVHQCPNLHPVLKDLSRLACKSNVEVDFFENIRHLQLHRRGRALLRFVQDAKDAEKPMRSQTLTGIILPLAFQYLFNTRYAKNNSLVDSAIEAVGAACHCLPWHHYEAILKHQLARLHREATEFGRQPIRLIAAILNNFHFDLSRADESSEQLINLAKPDDEPSQMENHLVQTADGEEEADEEIIGTETVEEEELLEKEEDSSCQVQEPAWSQDLLLPASAARRARKALSTLLLPRLHASLIAPTERDVSHKVNRRAGGAVGAEMPADKQRKGDGPKDEEDMLVMRVPIALAAVKMLQRLPSNFMVENLSGILLKVLAFLKCRLESVRRVARETLVEIGIALGPKYLPTIIREMSSLLLPARGYAFHVLSFTSHSLLVSLCPLMQPGDMNKCLRNFLEICKADLFGITAEEKEVTRITAKVYEARSHKSYDSFQLLAKVISESCLVDLIQPLKEVLDRTHSFKCVRMVKECLARVVKGLVENKFISSAALLTFSYGVLSKSISALWPSTPTQPGRTFPRRSAGAYAGVNGTVSKPLTVPSDPYLIPKEPRKVRSKVSGAVDKVGAQANSHTLTEFGLHLLHSLLKKEQIKWRKDVGTKETSQSTVQRDEENESSEIVVDIAMLDPLVPVVCECLESQHAKITTLALNCFRFLVRMNLPSMDLNLDKATKAVYITLHKYAGATSGDNYNLAVAAFKAVAVLVRNIKSLPVEEDHLSALLTYVSRDLDLGGEVGSMFGGSGPARTATAFVVLRSVLARKLRSAMIPPLMKRVAQLSILAEASHIQAQSRQVFLQFLLDYPMNKKKLESHVAFYLGQLNYELLSGRESALEFLQSVITIFPPMVLKNVSGTIFVSLAARLLEEEVPECRRRVAAVIKSMLLRLNQQTRDSLFSVLVIWMKDSEVSHQQIAAQLCGIFVLVESNEFSSRLPIVFPLIVEQLQGKEKAKEPEEKLVPGRFVRAKPDANGVEKEENCPGKFVRISRVDEVEQSDEKEENCPGKFVRISRVDEVEQSDEQEGEDSDASLEAGMEDDELKSEENGINAVGVQNNSESESGYVDYDDAEEGRDHHLFQLLQLILKMLMTCPATLSEAKWQDYINEIAVCSQNLLAYPHEWVRLASSQVLGAIFGSTDAAKVALAAKREGDCIKKGKSKKKKNNTAKESNINGIPFMFVGVKARLKSLILDLSAQLECNRIGPQFAEQVVKNLVFLARVLRNMEQIDKDDTASEAPNKEKEYNLTLTWMMHKMRKIVNTEVSRSPNQTILRSAVFKWLAAVALDLSNEPDHLKSHVHQILGPVIREVENKNKSEETRSKEMKELRRLAYEVCELIKEKVGLETYAEVVRDIQARLSNRRAERKRIRAQEVVSMPEKAAKRKIKKQLVKKQLKRRKISIMKGKKVVNKQKISVL